MIEVNDFDTVQIKLASPEKIRSWSYGEVTKPETINYRTLRPEKDGLFCEKIFGPTKDWECYCGKYKRVRYKGVICDKCGVEVARAKVRRERMGHIELAAPVSHIWFVKGTPSRVGLLLDISPRALERVLYFAQYIIISIDEDERARLLNEIEQGNTTRIADLEAEANARFEEIIARRDGELEGLGQSRESQLSVFDSRLGLEPGLIASARERLEELSGQVAEEDFTLDTPVGNFVLVAKGQTVDEDALIRLARWEQGGIQAAMAESAELILQEADALKTRLGVSNNPGAPRDFSFYGDILVRQGDSLSPTSIKRKVNVATKAFNRSAEEMRGQVQGYLGQEAPKDFVLRGETLIRQGETVSEETIRKLDTFVATLRADTESNLAELLQSARASSAPQDMVLRGVTVIRKGASVNNDTARKFDEAADDLIRNLASQLGDAQRETYADRSGVEALSDAEIELVSQRGKEEMDRIRQGTEEQIQALRADLETQRQEVEGLKPLLQIGEGKYRELHDKYSLLFRAGMGAEAIREIVVATDLDKLSDELRNEIRTSSSSGQRRKKATKRLRVVEAFRKSGNHPEWMILTVLPVLPPDLRPMVQLDGGRFATSDLNDLYRRVINRNNRLKRLLELGAPEIIIRNEKRMLQEAVDSLIDNGRRGRAVSGSSNHKLKSLSDMLKGKQGRFRQNLLGKRVDYSGRSVIIVGPTLKLHQCGLPKKMALELFKPFVMQKLVERGLAHNIKSAKRKVERVQQEVWDILEEVVKDHPVLLNRAPTLHRLGIQAFEPVLIDGSAIQIHPLVCSAFGADFDGDQMAVHVPLSGPAKHEARTLMLSSLNLLSPASGEPTVAPTLDMVLGCYYMTVERSGTLGEGLVFSSPEEAKLAYDLGQVHLHAPIKVRITVDGAEESELLSTTVGRVIFNAVLPQGLGYQNELMDRKRLRTLVGKCYRLHGTEETAKFVNDIKDTGFAYATKSGITIAIGDLTIPTERAGLLEEADKQIDDIKKQFQRGLITNDERYQQAVDVWQATTEAVTKKVEAALDRFGPIFMMTNSGAKGNVQQLRQMAGMRGLMTAPNGKIIELPIRSSFREGLSVLEYFISTHGARKGLADTAIRTADSGYLTRRLIDVAQDVIVYDKDCGTTLGIWASERTDVGTVIEPLHAKLVGRYAASPFVDPETGEVIVDRDEEINEERSELIMEAIAKMALEERRVHVRSPLTCQSRQGICQLCYGRSLARGHLVEIGEAVGIIAAESIGEPGTQLTMRTFHTGGIASVKDITSGLPRVEEIFEARVPKGQAVVSEIDGIATVVRGEDVRRIKVSSSEVYRDEQTVPQGADILVNHGDHVDIDTVLARTNDGDLYARMSGVIEIEDDRITVAYEDKDEREYQVPVIAQLRVENNQHVKAGDLLTEGAANPQDILRIRGREEVQLYMVDEVQRVYTSQGVTINDKHIEVIVRQLLRKVRVELPGDTDMLPGEMIERFAYEETNARVLAEGGEPAVAQDILLGITKASLSTKSFLAAASFQETTRVLTEAAIQGMKDKLVGLKENVIIGKLIPAGTGLASRRELARKKAAGLLAGIELIPGDGYLPSELLGDGSGDSIEGDLEDAEEVTEEIIEEIIEEAPTGLVSIGSTARPLGYVESSEDVVADEADTEENETEGDGEAEEGFEEEDSVEEDESDDEG